MPIRSLLLYSLITLLLVACHKTPTQNSVLESETPYGTGKGEPGYGICQESNPLRRCPLYSLNRYPWVVDLVGPDADKIDVLYCENRRALSAQHALAFSLGPCFFRWRSIGLDFGQQINPRCEVICLDGNNEITGETLVRKRNELCQGLRNRMINLRNGWDISKSPQVYINDSRERQALMSNLNQMLLEKRCDQF